MTWSLYAYNASVLPQKGWYSNEYSILYLILATSTMLEFILPMMGINLPYNNTFFPFFRNLLMCVPLTLTVYGYIKLLKETEKFKNKIYILIFGLSMSTIGLFLFAISSLLDQQDLLTIELGVIVIGLFIFITGFIYRPRTVDS